MSLRLRLALWYGSLTTFIVALVCGYSYAIHSRTHYDELDRVLHAIADHVVDELGTEPARRHEILTASLLLGAGTRLVDRNGHPLDQSRNVANVPALDVRHLLTAPYERPYSMVASLAPALHMPHEAPGRFGLTTDDRGNRTRLYTQPLPDSTSFLIATLPLDHIDAAVRSYAGLMVAMAIVGGAVAFGVGWLVARRALHPVSLMTTTAAAIAESRQFSRRVADGNGRDELGRLAHTFNAMLASLQDAYDAQVRFVSAASHELRAPLTVIQANVDLLSTAPMSDDERQTAIAEMSAEASRMTRLVADLLVLARADAGIAIRQDLVEVDRVLLDVVSEARHLTQGQRLEVREIEPAVVRGDPDRLKQVFLNVIENAIKYSPASGSVVVSIRRQGPDVVAVVQDNGVGINAEDLPHVFERFYRADPARSRDPGGSGLGLAIAQWVVSEHGGSIDLSSRVGTGTAVTIRLPAAN